MYGVSTNAMEICGCGIPWITIIVNSFTCYLFETTSTNDSLIHLKTKHRQPSLCLPNRLWSILHIVLHWSMALVWSKKPLQHQGCEYVYSCFLWDLKVILLCWRGRGWEDLGERNTFQEVVWEKSWNPVPEYVAKGPFFFFGDTPLNFQRFRDNVWKRPRSNMTSVFWASIGILGTRFSFLLHGGIECNFLQERSCLW